MKTIEDVLNYHNVIYEDFEVLSDYNKQLLIIEAFNSELKPSF